MIDSILSGKVKMHNHNPWETMTIAELFQPISDKGHGEKTVLTIIQGKGTQPRDSVDRRISYDKTNTNSYKRVLENDFVLHLRSFEAGLEIVNSEGIVSPAYTILRAQKEIDPLFFYSYFRSYCFISSKLRIAVEGIRDGKSINMDTFWKIEIPYPTIEEQRKISGFLTAINKKTETEQTILENLLKCKNGLLAQLFI